MNSCPLPLRRAAGLMALLWLWPGSPELRGATLSPPQEYLIDTWQTDSGLPDNTVTGIAQTPDGYLWCATGNNLARFDGVRFQVFRVQNTPELGSSRIQQVFVDRLGTLWISTLEGGLVEFKNGRFLAYKPPPGEHPSKAFIGFADDERGRLWLTTEDSEVVCFADGKFTSASAGWHKPGPFPCQVRNDYQGRPWVSSLLWLGRLQETQPVPMLECTAGEYEFHCPSHAGGWWISTERELRRWSDGQWVASAGQVAWSGRSLQHALEDRLGQVWFASLGSGVFLYKTNGSVLQFTVKNGLGGDFARCLFEDSEGNIWVGAEGGGISRLRRAVFHVYGRKQGLSSDLVTSVSEGKEGELWVGTDGDGLNRLENGKVLHYGPEEGVVDRHVQCVLANRQGNVRVGTKGWALLQLEGDRFIALDNYSPRSLALCALFEDARGRLWLGQQTRSQLVGLHPGGIESLELPQPQATVDVRTIAEDAEGNLCVGTDGSGLFVRRGQVWQHYTRANGLESDIIWSIHADRAGAFWIGTFGGGLARLKGQHLVTCTKKHGLAHDVICHIADDGYGNLWFSSYGGVFRAVKTELDAFADGTRRHIQCVTYGKSDGLPTLQCAGGRQPAGCRSGDGRLWFPTIKGLAVVDPATIERTTNLKPPPVHIEEVYVDGELQSLPRSEAAAFLPAAENKTEDGGGLGGASASPAILRIGPGRRRYEFRYTGLSFTAPENVRFKYRLEGVDEEWVEAGPTRAAVYAHVPPGRYTFRVTACNSDGVWNDTGAALGMVLLPHFWQTWWFRGGMPVALIGAAAWTILAHEKRKTQQRLVSLRQQNLLQRERARIAQDMHDEIGAQLTRISFLSEMTKFDLTNPAEAERGIDQVSETARELIRSLDEIVWAVNPKNDTLENLVNYIYRYTVHYLEDTEVQCRFDIPNQVPDRSISGDLRHNLFLGVKEALNNALKHSGAREVSLRIGIQDSRLEISVCDNGRGFAPALLPLASESAPRRVGNGLDNMRHRLNDFVGTCQIDSAPGKGTKVSFTLNLNRSTTGP